jgi:HEAT repeat protein
VTLALSSTPPRHLSGSVVYSRRVREGWFLTGLRFGRTQDARLQSETYDQIKAIDVREANQRGADAVPDGATTPRERMLRQLLSASVAARTTKEMADKVILASMCNDHVVRQASIAVLLKVGGQQAILSLIRLLNDDNPHIQGEAAQALGLMRASQALKPLRALLRQPDEDIAVRAAEALGRLGDQSGLRLVIRLLLKESQLTRRAARALGAIVGKEFHPNAEGVEQARGYVQANGL